MFHMREFKIRESSCVLVLLFSGLVTCSGAFGNPLTDDVATLGTLSENIPRDYRIPLSFISKDVGGPCWLHLNLFPVESSLKTLAHKFGNLSSNRANITIFITMLQGFRFTLDSEELEVAMQTFKCHYRRVKWPTRRYFAHVKEILTAAGSDLSQFPHCPPPPCLSAAASSVTPGKHKQQNRLNGPVRGFLVLLIVPCVVVLVLTVRMVFRRGGCWPQRRPEVTFGLHEPPDAGAESSPGPQSGAAQGDTDFRLHSQQNRAWLESVGCADTDV